MVSRLALGDARGADRPVAQSGQSARDQAKDVEMEEETPRASASSAVDENLSRDSGYDSLNGIGPKAPAGSPDGPAAPGGGPLPPRPVRGGRRDARPLPRDRWQAARVGPCRAGSRPVRSGQIPRRDRGVLTRAGAPAELGRARLPRLG